MRQQIQLAGIDVGSFMGNKNILMLDDSAWERQVAKVVLKCSGYEVIEASDGREALAILDRMDVGLIICDADLPNSAGIGFIEVVRQKDGYMNTPLVMLAGRKGETQMQRAQFPTADAWITRPFQPSHLSVVVSRLLLS